MEQLNFNIFICVFMIIAIPLISTHYHRVVNELGISSKCDLQSQQTGLQSFASSLHNSIHDRPTTRTTKIKNKLSSVLIIYLLILQCGDVHIHPGPVKYPCGICARNVAWNSKAIQCDGCNIWYHSKCANIGPRTYSLLSKPSLNLSWICTNCGIPNTSSQHSAELVDYSSYTIYSELSNISKQDKEPVFVGRDSVPSSSTPTKLNHPRPNLNIPPIRSRKYTSSHSNSVTSDPESSLVSEAISSPSYVSDLNNNNTSQHKAPNNLTCLIINFQSLRNKKTDLYNIISSLEPDVIMGDETYLDDDYLDAEILPFGIPPEHQYKVYRKDRKSLIDKSGGGVIIMVRPTYDCEDCPDLDTACELKWVKITTSRKDSVLIGSYYREPKSTIEALQQLDLSLSKIFKSAKYKNCKIFLGGDFNLGDINWTMGCSTQGARDKSHCDKLVSILNCYGLDQVNTLPTRQDRTLDLFITSHPTLVEKVYTCPPIGLSDHDILAIRTALKPTKSIKINRTVFNYKKANWEKVKSNMSDLCNEFNPEDRANKSVEENWNYFKEAVFRVMDTWIPKKAVKRKADVPWMTREIKRMTRKKKRMYKQALKHGKNSRQSTAFKEYRKVVRNKIHSSYHNYLKTILDPEEDTTSKNFWKYIKARKQDTMGIGTLKAKGKIAETPLEKANILNEQFTSVFTKEDKSNIPEKGPSPFTPMRNITISESGVRKSIQRLNEKKASGPDKIPITFLKKTVDIITPVISYIFQQSLDKGEIPTDWKNANIVPIYKKGDRTAPANYRPVSLTAVISKMLEHIIVSQIMDHLDRENILHENQHGFRAKRSCESQLLMTTDDIAKHLDQGRQVDMGILDFSKAFDKVPHTRLSKKLHYYGIQGTTQRWINNFLMDRQQQVVVDNATSSTTLVTSGVPQGTVLGPTLFLIYINDIADNTASTIRLFADDCVIYRPVLCQQDHELLQRDLNTLVNWSDTWQMEFNIKKCAIMQFRTSTRKKTFNYTMKGEPLQIVNHHPYLGIELSDNLKFNLHIDNICKKASSVLGFLKRNLRHCPSQVKERAYQSLVRPKLEYATPIWNPQQKTQQKQIEQVQRNAARFIKNKPYNPEKPDSVTSMMQELKWNTLEHRRICNDVILMYKITNQLIAVPVSYLPPLATVRGTRNSHCLKFVPYHCRINAYQHSFFPRIIYYWNTLPESAILSPSLEQFKTSIQNLQLWNTYPAH